MLRTGLVTLPGVKSVSARPGAHFGFPPKGLGLFPDDLLDLLSLLVGNTSCHFLLSGGEKGRNCFYQLQM